MDWTLEPYQKYSGYRASRNRGRRKITSHYYHAADGIRGIAFISAVWAKTWILPFPALNTGPDVSRRPLIFRNIRLRSFGDAIATGACLAGDHGTGDHRFTS